MTGDARELGKGREVVGDGSWKSKRSGDLVHGVAKG